MFELRSDMAKAFVIGRRFGVGAGVMADVWSGPTDVRPLPLESKPMFIVSDSTDDELGGDGAEFVVVSFVDGDGDWRVSDRLTMTGTTQVAITHKPDAKLVTEGGTATAPDGSSVAAKIFRVQSVSVVKAGGWTETSTRQTNIGNITVIDGAATVFDHAPAGLGRAHSAFLHAPRGWEIKPHAMNTGAYKAGGTAKASFDVGLSLGPQTAYHRLALSQLVDAMGYFVNDPAVTSVPPRSDFCVIATPESVGTDVMAVLEFRLYPIAD